MMLTELTSKQLEMAKEAMPHAKRIGVLWNPPTPSHTLALEALKAHGETLGVELQMIPLRTVEEFDSAFAKMVGDRADCFLDIPSTLTSTHPELLADLALKYRLGGVHQSRILVEAGGLMSYGADTLDLYRRAAYYVDRILKGEKPADLPVEQPTKFELAVNLKTAKALEITFPPSVLATADEVIE
jgi:putative ABC transport system substrate-binding protein